MKLVTVSEMRQIERMADASGWSYGDMMEAAGLGLGEAIANRVIAHSQCDHQVILGLVGPGNNGGDTLIALETLARRGYKTAAYLVRPRAAEDALLARLQSAGGESQDASADPDFIWLGKQIRNAAAIVDGVLGTGARLPLSADINRVLNKIRSISREQGGDLPLMVAVDCPSGVDCDSGEAASEALPADLTVCMAAVKAGLLSHPAANLTGELQVIDIGLPDDLDEWASIQREVVTPGRVRSLLPIRPPDAHKGTFGTALVIAGSERYCGAALLAGRACHRIGTGLVTCAVPRTIYPVLAGHFPESTWLPLPDEHGWIAGPASNLVIENLGRVTCALIGPGFGTQSCTQAFLENLFNHRLPALTIDADGLKLIARIPNWPDLLPPGCVLTPHPGEMSILTGLPVELIQRDRLGYAERFAAEWNQVLILKGAATVIAEPDGRTAVIPIATAALARAGTGDVLAGMVAGLLAQGLPVFEAALAAAYLQGRCGLLAEQLLGSSAPVLAGDVLDRLPAALQELTG